jgi:probable HAF family extracellular repeat protein
MALGVLVGLAANAKAQPSYSFTTIDVPGSSSSVTVASGINSSGKIVGSYTAGDGHHGFLLDNGSYTTLDVPGSLQTFASGINDAGQIVGEYWDISGHGFLFDNGNYTTLDVPGGFSAVATGINASGQIVGFYQRAADAKSLDELLTRLGEEDAAAARVAHLHLFGGLSVKEAGDAVGVSRAVAYRNWKYARAWLRDALEK